MTRQQMTAEEKREDRRKRAVLGPLPDSFLRIPVSSEPLSDEDRDREMALSLQKQIYYQEAKQQQQLSPAGLHQMTGRLTITIVEARLTKNYGVTRMDPYVRLRVGHNVYETPTCQNGAREPKWNKTVNCFIMQGIKTIDVEIYDECTFSTDTLVAHTSIPIPEAVLKGDEICDDWWPLSGQEGEGKEGMLHLVLSMQALAPSAVVPLSGGPLPLGLPLGQMIPNAAGGKAQVFTTARLPQQQGPASLRRVVEISEADLLEFSKMFPAIEKSVIQAVFLEKGGDKEETVNALLLMGQ